MRKYMIPLLALLSMESVYAQYNFGFENFKEGTDSLADWNLRNGQQFTGGTIRIDREEKHKGRQSLLIERTGPDSSFRFTPVSLRIPVDFIGGYIKASCWMKVRDVTQRAQMWLRMDDENGKMLKLVNYPTSLQGTKDWAAYDTTVALPTDATIIYLGFFCWWAKARPGRTNFR